jgi:hypothetical protein
MTHQIEEVVHSTPHTPDSRPAENEVPAPTEAPTADAAVESTNGTASEVRGWHAEAGRKGAHRVHQLIQEGKLYEQEHGLTSGRQRLRQLIELGKQYEQEHGLQPGQPRKVRERLSRMEREETLATFLQCLLRIAKPSFRAELLRLVEVVQQQPQDHAA